MNPSFGIYLSGDGLSVLEALLLRQGAALECSFGKASSPMILSYLPPPFVNPFMDIGYASLMSIQPRDPIHSSRKCAMPIQFY